MSAQDKMQAARTALVLDQPFFGALVLRLAVQEDLACPTAWTDGASIGYNPAFLDQLSHDEVCGLLAHEVLHCANGHPWRRDGRDHSQWNVACDYAINDLLGQAGFRLPAGALQDAQYAGKSAEWVYNRLPPGQPPPQQGGSGGVPGVAEKAGKGKGPAGQLNAPGGQQARPGTGACDVRDASPENAEHGATEADWQQAVQQAAAAAKARGTLPAGLERFAKAAAEPRVDWKSVLRRFVQASARADYSWTRPSVRHLARGLYLPSLRSEAMGPIAVAVDTSGSIDQVTLSQFATEVREIANELRPARVHVIYCDAKVGRVDTYEQDDVIELRPVGGGTAFGPALDAAEKLDDPPVCLVYLTDLQGSHRDRAPEFPVLWAATEKGSVPYGEVVSLER